MLLSLAEVASMSTCPYCASDVRHLLLFERSWFRFIYTRVNGEVRKTYVDKHYVPWEEVEEVFKCPACEKTIFANSMDARDFLLHDKASNKPLVQGVVGDA
ncbi:MAG: hypothetical protein ABIH11_07460 [Candidatus Altiarchaeota archaeon]